MLRDRLVCGVNDERIQRRLLAESQLEFKKAMELATAMETADKNTRDLQNGNPNARENPEEQAVNRVTKDPPKDPKPPPRISKQPNATRECFRCGGSLRSLAVISPQAPRGFDARFSPLEQAPRRGWGWGGFSPPHLFG